MQATLPALAARQGHVQRLGTQLGLQFGFRQGLAARGERGFNGLLGKVDGGAAGLFLVRTQGSHAFHQLGYAPGFAQEQRLGVFQIGGRDGFGKGRLGRQGDGVQIVHMFLRSMKKG